MIICSPYKRNQIYNQLKQRDQNKRYHSNTQRGGKKLKSLLKLSQTQQFADKFIFHPFLDYKMFNNVQQNKNQKPKLGCRTMIYSKKWAKTQREQKENINHIQTLQKINSSHQTKKQKGVKSQTQNNNIQKKQQILNTLDEITFKPLLVQKQQTNCQQDKKKRILRKNNWFKKKVWVNLKKNIKVGKNGKQNQFSPWTKVAFSQVISLDVSNNNLRQL